MIFFSCYIDMVEKAVDGMSDTREQFIRTDGTTVLHKCAKAIQSSVCSDKANSHQVIMYFPAICRKPRKNKRGFS